VRSTGWTDARDGAFAVRRARARGVRRFAPAAWPAMRRPRGALSRHESGETARRVTLYLAMRPFQVNPPYQSLNMPSRRRRSIDSGRYEGGVDSIACGASCRAASSAPRRTTRATSCHRCAAAQCPHGHACHGPFGYASAAWAYDLDLPRAARVRFADRRSSSGHGGSHGAGLGRPTVDRSTAPSKKRGACGAHTRTGSSSSLPDSRAVETNQTLRAQIGWILANRDGPAIQPGSRHLRAVVDSRRLTGPRRRYWRSGLPEVVARVRRVVRGASVPPTAAWPCCIDRRGRRSRAQSTAATAS
jgi:hypothetical protein